MRDIFRHLFTGKDNETQDLSRWGLGLALIVYLALSAWHAVHTGTFDYQAFCIGAATLLAGGAAGIKIKETTEPGGV